GEESVRAVEPEPWDPAVRLDEVGLMPPEDAAQRAEPDVACLVLDDGCEAVVRQAPAGAYPGPCAIRRADKQPGPVCGQPQAPRGIREDGGDAMSVDESAGSADE